MIDLTYLPIFFRVSSLALGQSYDCPSASELTLMNMGKIRVTKHIKTWTGSTFPRMYCSIHGDRIASRVVKFHNQIFGLSIISGGKRLSKFDNHSAVKIWHFAQWCCAGEFPKENLTEMITNWHLFLRLCLLCIILCMTFRYIWLLKSFPYSLKYKFALVVFLMIPSILSHHWFG